MKTSVHLSEDKIHKRDTIIKQKNVEITCNCSFQGHRTSLDFTFIPHMMVKEPCLFLYVGMTEMRIVLYAFP